MKVSRGLITRIAGLIKARVASVSVWFRSKERPRNGILGFGRTRNETKAKNECRGRGRKETLAEKPLDFENLRLPANAEPDWLR